MKRIFREEDKENTSSYNKAGMKSRRTKPKVERRRESIESQLECPICMNCFTSKVYVCANGHSLCSNCYEKIKTSSNKCPSCRTRLKGARNLAVENIVQHTILPCRYKENGCDFKVRKVFKIPAAGCISIAF